MSVKDDILWGTGYGFKNKTKKKRQYPEQNDQIAFSAWLHARGIKHHASPNGDKRSSRRGALLRDMGMWAGWLDVIIPVMRDRYGALFIELKAENGKLQQNQIECINYLRGAGYRVHVCYSLKEAQEAVLEYLALPIIKSLPLNPESSILELISSSP